MLVVAPVSAQTPPPDAAPAATAPADAGPAGVTPPTATATVENPYGLGALWAGGDFVSAIWYPPETQAYTITITGNGSVENYLYIVVK